MFCRCSDYVSVIGDRSPGSPLISITYEQSSGITINTVMNAFDLTFAAGNDAFRSDAVLLFSKYFDPEKHFLDNENTQFSG